MLINNSYTLREISKITGGKCIGNIDVIIKNIHYDSRKFVQNNGHLFIAFKTPSNDGHNYLEKVYESGIKQFLTHKVPTNIEKNAGYLIVKDSLAALQTWAAYHRSKFNIPILSITGSYGKTIIKEWIYFLMHRKVRILRSPKSYNSQFGAALTLLSIQKKHQLAIIETGISLPGEMSIMKWMINPTHVILSTIGSEHLENFSSLDQLKSEKELLLKDTKFTYFKNYNYFNRNITESGQKISYSFNDIDESFFISQKDEISFQNFICCLNFLNQIKFDVNEIHKLCDDLPEIALRFEKKAGIQNSVLINDSYHNNIPSLKIALETLKSESGRKKTTLIMSDLKHESFNYSNLNDIIQSYKISNFYGIGKNLFKNKNFFTKNSAIFKTVEDFLASFTKKDFHENFILIKGDRGKEFQKIGLKLEAKKHLTVLEINISNLIKNYNYYKNLISSETKFLVMIKAAGYGTGLIESAKILQQNHVDYLGVAYVDEGLQLRNNGIHSPILVMNVEAKSMEEIIEHKLIPSIYDLSQLNEFTNKLIGLGIKNFPVHIKLNTGMNRLGFDADEIKELCNFLLNQPEIKVEGIFSHLSASDEKHGKSFTRNQIKKFEKISDEIETNLGIVAIKHILNTSGIENYSQFSMDMVRLGIGIYGISKNNKILNVASLITSISKVRRIKKGEYVGYGLDNMIKKDMKIAIIPIGYADGFNRKLGNGNGRVFINNTFHKTVGNICMDMAFIDISNTDFQVGERVEIFGSNNPISEVAQSINTIPYEIISSISNRVVRVYHKD